MVENITGVIVFEVHQNGGNDLRVLVANEIGNRWRIHPFQAFNAIGVAALQNTRDQVRCLVVAERFG